MLIHVTLKSFIHRKFKNEGKTFLVVQRLGLCTFPAGGAVLVPRHQISLNSPSLVFDTSRTILAFLFCFLIKLIEMGLDNSYWILRKEKDV